MDPFDPAELAPWLGDEPHGDPAAAFARGEDTYGPATLGGGSLDIVPVIVPSGGPPPGARVRRDRRQVPSGAAGALRRRRGA